MPWFRVDDNLDQHPKADLAGNRALGLWVRAGSYSARLLTEGFVPTAQVARLGGSRADAQALVTAGLWEVASGGYQFHEWAERQPSRQQVEADRAAAAERQRRAREKAKEIAESREKSRRDDDDQSRRDSRRESRSPRPGPTQKSEEQTPPPPSASVPPTAKGTRIPDGFTPDPPMLSWVREKCPLVPASEHERFVDFWTAAAGAKGVKRDWPATWRTWMRRAQDDITTGRRPGARRSTTDDRVGQALSLRDKYAAIDAAEAEQQALATVTQLAIGDAS